MDRVGFEKMETWLQETARELPYPQTPDLAPAVRAHLAGGPARRPLPRVPSRWAWVVTAALAVLLLGVLAVPSVRAGILEFIQVGVVRIFLVTPPTATPAPSPVPSGTPAPTQAPTSTPTPVAWLTDLAGETTLPKARERVFFDIPLPAYPGDLGEPDQVYVQDLDGPLVVLVWLEPGSADQVRMSLHLIAPGSIALEKVEPVLVEETQVNGHYAAWTTGPYLLRLKNNDLDIRRMIAGGVLIWEQEGITYRLESSLPLEEAVKVAESLR
jgi:hypothetical protein